MQCRHGSEIIVGGGFDLRVSCRDCSQRVLRNSRILRQAFAESQFGELYKWLISQAVMSEVGHNGQQVRAAVVIKIDELVNDTAGRRVMMQIHNAAKIPDSSPEQPRLVYYDRPGRRVFIFNPLVEDQKWSKLIGLIGANRAPVAPVDAIAPPDPLSPKKPRIDLSSYPIQSLPLTAIVPARGGQIRHPRSPDFSQRSIDELAGTIADSGVLRQIVVRDLTNGQYEICDGERRWRAAQQLGLTEITAHVMPADTPDKMFRHVMVVGNIGQAPNNFLEIALEAARWANDHPEMTLAEIAKTFGRSTSWLSQVLPLAKLPDDVIDEIMPQVGNLSIQEALRLTAIPNPQVVKKALGDFRQHVLSRKKGRLPATERGRKLADFIPGQTRVTGGRTVAQDRWQKEVREFFANIERLASGFERANSSPNDFEQALGSLSREQLFRLKRLAGSVTTNLKKWSEIINKFV